MSPSPSHIDVKKDRGITIQWADGSTSYYSVAYLRKMSPSAEMRQLREEQAKNPLTVLPASAARGQSGGGASLVIADVELVGHYAVRLRFSDGHDTGIYSWEYLREIDPQAREQKQAGGPKGD